VLPARFTLKSATFADTEARVELHGEVAEQGLRRRIANPRRSAFEELREYSQTRVARGFQGV